MSKILFSTSSYEYLAKEVMSLGKYEEGIIERKVFADGESYHRIVSEVENRNVILVGGTHDDHSTLELFDLACSLVRHGADSVGIVVPYFGYSTMERAIKPGEVVKAKSRARLLSAIPRSNKGNKLYLFDLHTEGLPYYFSDDLTPMHIYCKDIIMQAAKEYGGDEFVLACTDSARAKWIESLAKDMHVTPAFLLKRRNDSGTEVVSINADVKNKVVVIYDDIIRSGGSAIKAAYAYKKAGAADIYLIATHGLFVNQGLEKLKAAGIKKIVCTNTHPNVVNIKDEFLEIKSVAELIHAHLDTSNRKK